MASTSKKAVAPTILLPRSLVKGTQGRDVVAVKRALSRAGFMEWGEFTQTWGENAVNANHAFQRSKKIKPAGYGPRTHNALRTTRRKGHPKEWAFGQFERQVMHDEYERLHLSPETLIRASIVQFWRWVYNYRGRIPYEQSRPFPLIHTGEHIEKLFAGIDCSAFFSEGHFAAGARNPNVVGGRRLSWEHDGGVGYTVSLKSGGRICSKNELKPGDAVLYGFTTHSSPAFPYGSPTHIAGWEGVNDAVYTNGHYPMTHAHYRYRHDINSFVTFDVTP